ncbi:hypothetical protein WN48_04872 [Eufriesea mexicana]|uniref:Uncharacterized protein n=1 Tax=Eufriesea mexicana TaxID=516756 RepID=A0A310SNC6_9HYME|nr:PREDICTED: uncharacterized protein LOC108550642 [Eufriesea mexicana]OAD55358.1 hypothetical protein WN48_04872 [Eufriesea mexicana]
MLSRGRKAQFAPWFSSVEIVMCLWITCAVLTLVASQQKFYIQGRYGKRQEPRADSFYISGGRYGRSEHLQKPSKSLPKLVEVEVPRIERYLWGGRYGKRPTPDYRTVSSVNRFSAVLNFMDQVDLDRENDVSDRNDLDPLP